MIGCREIIGIVEVNPGITTRELYNLSSGRPRSSAPLVQRDREYWCFNTKMHRLKSQGYLKATPCIDNDKPSSKWTVVE